MNFKTLNQSWEYYTHIKFVCWYKKNNNNNASILTGPSIFSPVFQYCSTALHMSRRCACVCLGCTFSLSVRSSINLVAPLIWHRQAWKHISDRSQRRKFNIPLCPQSSASSSLDPWWGRVPLRFWSRSRVSPSGGHVSPPSCLYRITYSGWGPRVVEEAWNAPSFLPHRGLSGRVGPAPGSFCLGCDLHSHS